MLRLACDRKRWLRTAETVAKLGQLLTIAEFCFEQIDGFFRQFLIALCDIKLDAFELLRQFYFVGRLELEIIKFFRPGLAHNFVRAVVIDNAIE